MAIFAYLTSGETYIHEGTQHFLMSQLSPSKNLTVLEEQTVIVASSALAAPLPVFIRFGARIATTSLGDKRSASYYFVP